MTCAFQDCTNNKFAPHEECALHCVKGNYQNDRRKSVLSEFYKLLRIYIADFLATNSASNSHNNQSLFNSSSSPYKRGLGINFSQIFRDGDLDDEENRNLIRRTNTNDLIVLHNIFFPDRKSKDSFDYFKLLKFFSGIHLLDCHLYIGDWQLEDINFFFQDCIFYNQFDVTPVRMLSNDTNCLFSECEFKSEVKISPTELNSIFEDSLFSGCSFENDLVIESSIFKKEVISYTDNAQSDFFSIEISKCIFEDKIKINNMNLAYLSIEDTEFQSKLEIKETIAQVFIFKNSNVSKVFDLFGSSFIKAEFSKSIFNDFAGFEDVQFGSEQEKGNREFLTIFKYVTFMDFSSFRGAKFSSGLDFSKTNLKDTPNFLDVNVGFKNTTRETFRIIKNSFDDVGNNIEANKFFSYEMRAYMIELSNKKGFFLEKVVLYSNFIISDFGRNYIRPLLILVCLLFIYVKSYIFYKVWYQSSIYTLPDILSGMSEELNAGAKGFLPFARFIEAKKGFEFISVLFYILFAILIWQIVVAVKRHTQR